MRFDRPGLIHHYNISEELARWRIEKQGANKCFSSSRERFICSRSCGLACLSLMVMDAGVGNGVDERDGPSPRVEREVRLTMEELDRMVNSIVERTVHASTQLVVEVFRQEVWV